MCPDGVPAVRDKEFVNFSRVDGFIVEGWPGSMEEPGCSEEESMIEPVLRPVAIFPRSTGNNCPTCRKPMAVSRCEDFEVLQCNCGYSCRQQSGEMKLEWHSQMFERTAQQRSQA